MYVCVRIPQHYTYIKIVRIDILIKNKNFNLVLCSIRNCVLKLTNQ